MKIRFESLWFTLWKCKKNYDEKCARFLEEPPAKKMSDLFLEKSLHKKCLTERSGGQLFLFISCQISILTKELSKKIDWKFSFKLEKLNKLNVKIGFFFSKRGKKNWLDNYWMVFSFLKYLWELWVLLLEISSVILFQGSKWNDEIFTFLGTLQDQISQNKVHLWNIFCW